MKIRPADRIGPDAASPDSSLTSAQFHILLTLTGGSRHGYGIMQEIRRRTEGAMELGPGTLYRSIKHLLARGLIVEVDREAGSETEVGKQRRSYALTPDGKECTAEEARRLKELVRWAENALVLEGGRP